MDDLADHHGRGFASFIEFWSPFISGTTSDYQANKFAIEHGTFLGCEFETPRVITNICGTGYEREKLVAWSLSLAETTSFFRVTDVQSHVHISYAEFQTLVAEIESHLRQSTYRP